MNSIIIATVFIIGFLLFGILLFGALKIRGRKKGINGLKGLGHLSNNLDLPIRLPLRVKSVKITD
ncbi:MAG: hypothetical protein SH819_00555 [Cytophagales bacterium]|nr:hypothetical protein [Cytophagales bacterium]